MTRKEIVEIYSPNDINENNKGGVYSCPYNDRYSEFLFVSEKECMCSRKNTSAFFIPKEVCEKCWNMEVNDMEYIGQEITVSDRDFMQLDKKAHAKRRELENEGWGYKECHQWTDGDEHYIGLYFIKPKQKETESKGNTMSKKSSKNIVVEWAKEIMNIAKLAYGAQGTYKNEYLRQIIGSCENILITLDCCDNENSD